MDNVKVSVIGRASAKNDANIEVKDNSTSPLIDQIFEL